MRYIIWGIGERLEKNIRSIHLEEVICFIDRRAASYPEGYKGKDVISPENLKEYKYDAIVVSSSKFRNEIIKELIFRKGIPQDKIMMLDDLLPENRQIHTSFLNDRLAFFLCHYDRESYERLFQGADKYYLKAEYGDNEILDDSGDAVSIYVVSHKNYQEVAGSLYKTIWVGGANNCDLPGIHDNTGNNISDMNTLINECTALYWVWKNDKESEYIGLNHYRRFFASPLKTGFPLDAAEIKVIMRGCDVLVSQAAVLDKTVPDKMRDQICEEAFEAGYSAIRGVFEHRSVEERTCFERFIAGNVIYPRQMFVMRRELLDEYCSWLFPILFEMVKKVEIKDSWDTYSKRVIGFWAERMLTVWLLYTRYRIEELPVILTDDGIPYGMSSDGEGVLSSSAEQTSESGVS